MHWCRFLEFKWIKRKPPCFLRHHPDVVLVYWRISSNLKWLPEMRKSGTATITMTKIFWPEFRGQPQRNIPTLLLVIYETPLFFHFKSAELVGFLFFFKKKAQWLLLRREKSQMCLLDWRHSEKIYITQIYLYDK